MTKYRLKKYRITAGKRIIYTCLEIRCSMRTWGGRGELKTKMVWKFGVQPPVGEFLKFENWYPVKMVFDLCYVAEFVVCFLKPCIFWTTRHSSSKPSVTRPSVTNWVWARKTFGNKMNSFYFHPYTGWSLGTENFLFSVSQARKPLQISNCT